MEKALSIKPTADVILPVYYGNIKELEESVDRQVDYFRKNLKDYNWNIVVSVNGKNPEKILDLSKRLSKKYKEVRHIYSEQGGKGVGVIEGWRRSKADIRAYMDIDLSTGLDSTKMLFDSIRDGYDIAIGSRYHPESDAKRSFKRWIFSKVYLNFFFKLILGVKCNDAQCGFKAVNPRVVENILPLIRDRDFFFESEMLYHAYKKGYKIKEVPIKWTENEFSSVNIIKTIPRFIRAVLRLKFSRI